ncbi:MAG: glycerol dehydratase reactivase beta/small subunit family protein [Eubacterium sp.]|nr:glycerol dehydratase reactivase beta/small subunit family protein [Eubacterium sp.]
MNVNFEAPKPEIKVYYNKNSVNKSIVTQVLLGIEEEGLPYSLVEKDSSNGGEMAYKAAEASHLGVGIGIGDTEIVLQYIKLKENEPLFRIPIKDDETTLRAIGANAARLVKRMPFKDIGNAAK